MLNCKYEFSDKEKERFIGLIINYGMACLDVGMADYESVFTAALDRKSKAFKSIVEFFEFMKIDLD